MSRNDITNDLIATKPASDAFRDGFERIFGKPSACKRCPIKTAYGQALCGECMQKDEACPCEPGKCTKPAEDCTTCSGTGSVMQPRYLGILEVEVACACRAGECKVPAERCKDWNKRGAG